MLDTVGFNHVQHISFTQSRLTDAVSVILSELLSYEHPPNDPLLFSCRRGQPVQLFFHLRAEAELLAVLHADIIDASDVFLIEQVDRT